MELKTFNIEENISRLVMVAIGILCIGLSIWYTSLFFIRDSELPAVIAISLSSAIAIFNSFALAAATFLVHRKKWIMAIIFIPIWMATTAFDIFTVAGSQSYRFQMYNQEQAIELSQNSRTDLRFQLMQTDYNNALEDQRRLTEELRSRDETIRDYDNQLRTITSRRAEYLDDQSSPEFLALTRQWNSLEANLRTSRSERDTISSQLNEARLKVTETLNTLNQEIVIIEENNLQQIAAMPQKVSFANWLHQIFPNIQLQHIQFFLAIVPAFFIDLISPIAMSFGLTLAKDVNEIQNQPLIKKKEDEEDESFIETPMKEYASPPVVAHMQAQFKEPVRMEFEGITPEKYPEYFPDHIVDPLSTPEQKREEFNRLFPEGEGSKVLSPEEVKEIDNPKETVEELIEKLKDKLKRKRRVKKEIEEKDPNNSEEDFEKFQLRIMTDEESAELLEKTQNTINDIKELEKPLDTPSDKIIHQTPFLKPKVEAEIEEGISELNDKKSEELIHYRFGKTTKDIMNRAIEFINLCIKDVGDFYMHPDYAATQLKLSNRAKQVFIDRLLAVRLGTKSLISRNKYGEFYANYSSKQIIDYISGIIND